MLNTWKILNLCDKTKLFLKNFLLNQAKKADIYETQTNIAQKGIMKNLKVNSDSILVFPNVINDRIKDIYSNEEIENIQVSKFATDKITIFTLSADYSHKNLLS